MAHSMTGYGRAQTILHEREILVEVKSVNARYFEFYSRLPRNCSFLDDALKKAVAKTVARGKLELNLRINAMGGDASEVQLNLNLVNGYYNAIAEISKKLGILNDATATSVARFNDVFTLEAPKVDEDELRLDVVAVAEKAVKGLQDMRFAEGEKLAQDIKLRLSLIEDMLCEIEKDSAARMKKYVEKLTLRLNEVLADVAIDEARVLTEAAVFADKTAIDEETVRLRSHLKQFYEILAQKGAIGRKLDFLTQEVNREVNTIGSKCQDVDVTKIVVEMKSEVEKIREQIQNIE